MIDETKNSISTIEVKKLSETEITEDRKRCSRSSSKESLPRSLPFLSYPSTSTSSTSSKSSLASSSASSSSSTSSISPLSSASQINPLAIHVRANDLVRSSSAFRLETPPPADPVATLPISSTRWRSFRKMLSFRKRKSKTNSQIEIGAAATTTTTTAANFQNGSAELVAESAILPKIANDTIIIIENDDANVPPSPTFGENQNDENRNFDNYYVRENFEPKSSEKEPVTSVEGKSKFAACCSFGCKNNQRFDRLLYYLRVFLTHLFSTTGLCFLVVAYSGLGAVIFSYLESKESKIKFSSSTSLLSSSSSSIEEPKIKLAIELWSYTERLNVFDPPLWIEETIRRISAYEQTLIERIRNGTYILPEPQDPWTFSGALLYSVTVITTIGYGNVTCKTAAGRIATILYAIIGIPITFLCLSNLGNLMAKAFRFSYRKLRCGNLFSWCCCHCFFCFRCLRFRSSASNHKNGNRKASTKRREQKPVSPSIANTIVAVSPLAAENKAICTKITDSIEIDIDNRRTINKAEEKEKTVTAAAAIYAKMELINKNKVDFNDNPQTDDNDDIDDEKDRVPITLVFLLVLGYIILGAVMFSSWEQWGPIEGAYFCFTTLATIGFGDLVPGSAKLSENKDGQTKFIICCAYMMIGLALIAMSFNLVQEEIVIKCRRFGRKIGIIPANNSLAVTTGGNNGNYFYSKQFPGQQG